MLKKNIDLHLHSNFSDGLSSPEELALLVKKADVRLAALTDHDTVAGTERFLRSALELGFTAIPGIEFSAKHEGKELHILGYGIDIHNEELLSAIEELRKTREKRAPLIIEKLNKLGFALDYAEITKNIQPGKAIGRPEIAEMLVRHGYVKNWSEAFSKYIGDNGPAFVDKEKIPAEECIRLIKNAGGFAVLAHPALELGMSGEKTVRELVRFGLSGIEAYYAKHTKENAAYYAFLAAKYGLFITGGSDFHKAENDTKHAPIGSLSLPDNHV